MILSFPIDAWALLAVAVGLGLALEVAFYRARRHDGAGSRHDLPTASGSVDGEGDRDPNGATR